MASVRSTIELLITGSTRGLNAASVEARRMAERVAAAEDRVSDARRRSAEAESRVADVEARLAGARAQHTAALSQIGVAETRLERVRADANEGATNLARAEADLERIRAGGGSTQEIEAAERRITQVRQESDLASRRVQAAEAQLERARGRAGQTGGQITALEERLAQARGNAFRASEDLARAENNLNVVRRRGTDDMNRQRDGLLGIFDAFGRLAQAFSGVDGASTSLLSKLGALQSVITSIGGPIVQAVAGILELVAVLGALGEIVGVVGGLIGQLVGGAVPLLVTLAAAAGTVALGMDGIKKAAEAAEPAFNKLKAAVSDTFTRELTPAFRDLAGVIPKLTAGFQDIARAISILGSDLVRVVTSARGLADIKTILAGTSGFITGISHGITDLFRGILTVSAAAAPAMEALGVSIGNIFTTIEHVFNKLSADGTIRALIINLAGTFRGLGDVLGPVIELLLRMGAALNIGNALSELGRIIQSSIPFFEHLASVAGDLLVTAFQQIGPAIRDVITQLLPGANNGLDGFANTIKTVVIPAIADFIRNIPGMIDAIKNFFLGVTAAALSFASTFLAAISSILGVLHDFFATMALIPGPFQENFARAAAATEGFKTKVDELKAGVDALHDKTVKLQLQTQGEQVVAGVQGTIDRLKDKTIKVISNVFGLSDNEKLKQAVDDLPVNKSITTTSTVTGEAANRTLTDAINLVQSKTTTTLSNVFGEPQNKSLKGAIDAVQPKTVDVRANVFGEGAVSNLINLINDVHSKSVDVISNVITHVSTVFDGPRASGGPVAAGKTYLVGEKGPELLTIGGTGGFVTDAARSRRIMNANSGAGQVSQPTSGDVPITVNVMLSQEQIAGIAQVEIVRQNRATKRTVLAGSGTTF